MHTDDYTSALGSSLKAIVEGFIFFCVLFSSDAFPAEKTSYQNACKENNPFLHCEEIHHICQRVEFVGIPGEDKATTEEMRGLAKCISSDLYYGEPSDPVKARKCAYLQIEQNRLDGPFDGMPILMRVYANGEGVKTNPDLALKLACDDDMGALAEYEGRILALNELRQAEDNSQSFDYCDYVTSGLMQGYCARRDAGIKQRKRTAKFAALITSWSASDKQEFKKLQVAWQKYLEASDGEVDQSGTARVALVIENSESLEENFLSSLMNFNGGEFPSYNNEDFALADREMNQLYKRIQGETKDQALWGTVTKDDIRKVQRVWLNYRDAWVAFAKQKFPSVTASAWKTWLTRERIEQLKLFSEIP